MWGCREIIRVLNRNPNYAHDRTEQIVHNTIEQNKSTQTPTLHLQWNGISPLEQAVVIEEEILHTVICRG